MSQVVINEADDTKFVYMFNEDFNHVPYVRPEHNLTDTWEEAEIMRSGETDPVLVQDISIEEPHSDTQSSSTLTEESSIILPESPQDEQSGSTSESDTEEKPGTDANTKRGQLTCMYTNTDSLLGKRDLLKANIDQI